MGFSHKGGHSLRKERIGEQSGAKGRETHVGSHCCFHVLLLICYSCDRAVLLTDGVEITVGASHVDGSV